METTGSMPFLSNPLIVRTGGLLALKLYGSARGSGSSGSIDRLCLGALLGLWHKIPHGTHMGSITVSIEQHYRPVRIYWVAWARYV